MSTASVTPFHQLHLSIRNAVTQILYITILDPEPHLLAKYTFLHGGNLTPALSSSHTLCCSQRVQRIKNYRKEKPTQGMIIKPDKDKRLRYSNYVQRVGVKIEINNV